MMSLSLAVLLAAPVVMEPNEAWAQDAAAEPAAAPDQPAQPGAAAPAEKPIPKEVQDLAKDFWHYASIHQFALAATAGQQLLALNADAGDVLRAFEKEVGDRNRVSLPERRKILDDQMLFWAQNRNTELAEVARKLTEVFSEARKRVAMDPAFIAQQIERLAEPGRGFANGVSELRNSGEWAVPVMIHYLRDPAKERFHLPIRRAIGQLGISVLNPLLVSTEMKDPAALTWVISSLGDIKYTSAIPYLVRVHQSADSPETIKAAAAAALRNLGVTDPQNRNAARLFLELAEKHYDNKSDLALPALAKTGFVWNWTEQGLRAVTVPAQTHNEALALRTCEAAIKLDPALSEAASLWIAAGFKREAQVPEGATDPLWGPEHPATHFYATASGTTHLYPVLSRALEDQDAAVALKAIKSLQAIVGATSLAAGDSANPIIAAMAYPDRVVRFEAAFAIAKALPQREFGGQESVVPILGEAIAQTGKPGVVILAPADQLNTLREQLKAYNVQGGETAENALANAAGLPSVDAIVLFERNDQTARVFEILSTGNARLARVPRIVIAASAAASPYADANRYPFTVVTTATDEPQLTEAINKGKQLVGALAIDEKAAADFAIRSAQLIQRLAMTRGQVLDLSPAQPALLGALDDVRPEVARAAGDALGYLNSREAQLALATKALDEKTDDEFRILLLRNLANHAQYYRNQLEPGTVDALSRLAETSMNLEVRSAAAEALGALNLKSEQIKSLIVNQAK
jgi:hypothetical protein